MLNIDVCKKILKNKNNEEVKMIREYLYLLATLQIECENNVLNEMKDVPEDKRSAHFTSAICCILPDGSKIEVEGRCDGKIAFEPFGDKGFGYDPVFLYGDKSYAQLTAEEKDKVSHRGKSLRKLQVELKKYFDNSDKD